jgi:hypothetical protein
MLNVDYSLSPGNIGWRSVPLWLTDLGGLRVQKAVARAPRGVDEGPQQYRSLDRKDSSYAPRTIKRWFASHQRSVSGGAMRPTPCRSNDRKLALIQLEPSKTY